MASGPDPSRMMIRRQAGSAPVTIEDVARGGGSTGTSVDEAERAITERAAALRKEANAEPDEASEAVVIPDESHSPREPRLLLQDFTPIAASLEWRLGQSYWSVRGIHAFTTQEVPNLTNNDGMGAYRAADTLFENCVEAEAQGMLEERISVAEVGAGLGLHARFLLDRFKRRCRDAGKDYYDRLTFYVGDTSRQTLLDIVEHKLFAPHAAHVRVGLLDALDVSQLIDVVTGEVVPLSGALRAVFCNYILDVLPFDILENRQGRWYELRVRAQLSDIARIHDATPMSIEDILAHARRADEAAIRALVPVYSYVRVTREWFPVDIEKVPYGDVVQRFFRERIAPALKERVDAGNAITVPNCRGALASIDSILGALRPAGFLLFNDYGPVTPESVAEVTFHQRFAGSTAIGLNFPLIEYFLAQKAEPVTVTAPPRDEPWVLHARCVTQQPMPATHAAFGKAYDRATYDRVFKLAEEAKVHLSRNEHNQAMAKFMAAHELEPQNWLVLVHWGRAVLWSLKNPREALPILERALAINPVTSSDLWNEYGDALYLLERIDDAHDAYLRALAANPEDPRTLFNLSFTYLDRADYARALESAGRALACDRVGEFHERILKKQAQILARQRAAYAAEQKRIKGRLALL